ncbi:MAG: hypothetical protein ACPGQS_06890, partial [Bradymonadia bacterium]
MYKDTPRSVSQIRRFVTERGEDYLNRFNEEPVEGAEWLYSSHGAVIRVVGEYDNIFERLLVVVPRPREAPPERFQSWVKERLEGLAWYMEASNTGKCVRSQVGDSAATAIIMRRIGSLLGGAQCPAPGAHDVYGLLERFLRDLRSYVRNIGDESLRYVRSLRLFEVPRKDGSLEFVIGLDILPTLVGLQGDSVPIHPLTLARGTIGEVAELLDGQLDANTRKKLSRTERKAIKSAVKHLDSICIQIDSERPDLEGVQQLLKATRQLQEEKKGSTLSPIFGALVLLVGLYWIWSTF